jgi:hypothetical protein
MLNDEQMAQYEVDGVVTVDSPFTEADLDRYEAAWDRWVERGEDPRDLALLDDPDYVEIFQQPFFEEVAKKLLYADSVHLWSGWQPHNRAPYDPPFKPPEEQWREWSHVDMQATMEDFNARPRRVRAEMWFWLNDLPADRGAMRVLPGSHRTIMEHWSRVVTPEHKKELPRLHQVKSPPLCNLKSSPEHVPDLLEKPWVEYEPVPMVAKRGQVLLICTTIMHSHWVNKDTVSRKAVPLSFVAEGAQCGISGHQIEHQVTFMSRLREKFPPDRQYLIPTEIDYMFASEYEPKWEETCLPMNI